MNFKEIPKMNEGNENLVKKNDGRVFEKGKSPLEILFPKKEMEKNDNLEFKKSYCNIDKNIEVHLPKENGIWESEKGNSRWVPSDEYIPKSCNPENKSFGEIKKEYNFEGIDFRDSKPDFSKFSKGEVQIEDFGVNRTLNFRKADELLAVKEGKTVKEIKDFRKDSKYTWHEIDSSGKMELIPAIIHANIPHSGGISEKKNELKGVK